MERENVDTIDEQEPVTPVDERDTTGPDDEPLGEAGRRALEAERKARREAEQKLAALAGRVEALQRAEAERLAGGKLADPRDMWAAGVELDGLLDNEGALNADKVVEAVDGLLAERPHWAKAPRLTGSADAGRGEPASEPSLAAIADQIVRGDD